MTRAGRDDRGPPQARPNGAGAPLPSSSAPSSGEGGDGGALTLCLAGDVMTGRGVDQVLPHSVDPGLHERFVTDARRYVELAERESGQIPEPVDFGYVWGDALEAIEARSPDATVVNLETAVTTHGVPWSGKGIHYRMHPGNVPLLTSAGVDVCVLANNHALDWGREGLTETLAALRDAGLRTAGAGADLAEARSPAVLPPGGREAGGRRILVFAYGSATAGVPRSWAARADRSGVALLPDLGEGAARDVARRVRAVRREGDVAIVSLHWGGNWGYRVPERQRAFARHLVEQGGVDVVHGHSSHHPRGTEIRDGRPVLYGCGDLINDYEGISGHEEYRPELVLLWFVSLEAGGSGSAGEPAAGDLPPDEGSAAASGAPAQRPAGDGPREAPRAPADRSTADGPASVEAVPFRLRRFRLERAGAEEARWLAETLDRESRELGARVELTGDRTLRVRPAETAGA